MPSDERKKAADAQERGLAERVGAKLHKGSGSGKRRMDMHTDTHLIECKTVLGDAKSITIKGEDLDLLSYHAALEDKVPALHIEIGGRRWVLVPEDEHDL